MLSYVLFCDRDLGEPSNSPIASMPSSFVASTSIALVPNGGFPVNIYLVEYVGGHRAKVSGADMALAEDEVAVSTRLGVGDRVIGPYYDLYQDTRPLKDTYLGTKFHDSPLACHRTPRKKDFIALEGSSSSYEFSVE